MSRLTNRREFLGKSAVAGVGLTVAGSTSCSLLKPKAVSVVRPRVPIRKVSPNERLNIACIGVGGKGEVDTNGVASENIVALCDVDETRAARTLKKYPSAKKYRDFRKMLDELQNSIDAVVVSTPDHMHAPAAMMAMQLGKHVYCQKPLAHTVWEARMMAEAAARYGVATQMGNQGHSYHGHRRAVELVQAGVLGPVREVHVWTDRPIWPQGLDRPTESESVPPTLDWDLWLGPAPKRSYNHIYLPFNWRGWWDFGCGALGDMGCHNMDVAFWGLKLGAPTSVEAVKISEVHTETAPKSSIIRWEFPARDEMPPATLTWYDGSNMPDVAVPDIKKLPTNGCLFVGTNGRKLLAPDWHADKFQLLPKKEFEGFAGPKETLPRSDEGKKELAHYEEWIAACKGAVPALSNFSYSGPMTEAVVLGNVALRLGKKIEWDSAKMKAKGCPEAEPLIRAMIPKEWWV